MVQNILLYQGENMRFYIADLKNHVGEEVELKGWTYNSRSSGKVKFLEIRDGTGIVPCIFFEKDLALISSINLIN